MGDPRPVPASKEEYYALLKERGIVRLPNPRVYEAGLGAEGSG